MAENIEMYPCNALCSFLLMPKRSTEYLCTHPENGFIWLFKALRATNQFYEEHRKKELNAKIVTAYQNAITKNLQAKTNAQYKETFKIILGAALTALVACLPKKNGPFDWLKSKPTRNLNIYSAQIFSYAFTACFPAKILKIIHEQELYLTKQNFSVGIAKMLGKDPDEFKNSWLVKCYNYPENFLQDFFVTQDKVKALDEFFSDLKLIFDYAKALDKIEEDAALMQAFTSIKEHSQTYQDPNLMEEIKTMLGEISNETCKKIFESKQ